MAGHLGVGREVRPDRRLLARVSRWVFLRALALCCIAGIPGPAAADDRVIDCGSHDLLVDLSGLDGTCWAGQATGRDSGGDGRGWAGRHEKVEANGAGVEVVILAQHAAHQTEIDQTDAEMLISLPSSDLESTENWSERYQLQGYNVRDFTFILDGPMKGWRCSVFARRDSRKKIVFGRFCKQPGDAAASVDLGKLLASIRYE